MCGSYQVRRHDFEKTKKVVSKKKMVAKLGVKVVAMHLLLAGVHNLDDLLDD